MNMHELIYNLEDVDSVAYEIYQLLPLCKVFTFTGSLGAGKTTLIQALLRQAGIHDVIQSPTFTYMTEYCNAQEKIFYHFDLYRVKTMQDFLVAGFHEYLYVPQSWSLIEWPEIIAPLVREMVCHISIDYSGGNRRTLRYELK
jgi:tRNA threonylcarbamoyladenosine biosynthesis protein TsaE